MRIIISLEIIELILSSTDPRNEDGKPTTEPKNICISAPSSGKIKESYFSVLGYTTIGDLYIDPATVKKR